jgi:hypothetical protein
VADTLAAVSSITGKTINQDACRRAVNAGCELKGVVVADGIGSHCGAHVAAEVAARAAADALEHLTPDAPLDLVRLFARVNDALTTHVLELPDLPPDINWDEAFGTTLLCAFEAADAVYVAYLGNGAVLHVRGDFNTFPATQLLPWSAVNLLGPQSVSQRGKNTLYKFLGPRATAGQIVPTVVTLSKDHDFFGDIIVVCTDGIASQDQTPVGLDDANQLWVRGDATIAMLYERLSQFFASPPYSDDGLESALDGYLHALLERGLVSDDCTLGVVVTPVAQSYQMARRVRVREAASV